jgi:probable rRNA maturation factor
VSQRRRSGVGRQETRVQRLAVSVTDEGGRTASPRLGQWLAGVSPARVRGSVSVALVSDAAVRRLNQRYRRKNTATDVLSFPALPEAAPARPQGRRRRFLGDIVIARGVARRQARQAQHSEDTELRILALHGLLHLLGYDHHTDNGEMAKLEQRLRSKGGLREGLIERALR